MPQTTSSHRQPPRPQQGSMPFSLVSSLGVGLTLALLGTALAEPAPPPPPPDRVVIGEISRGCSRDGEGTRAIIARLRQGGVRVDSTPLGRPECVGPNCAEKLGEKDKEGYLLGGDIRPTESTLWLVALKTDQIYIRRYLSNGEADLTVLARQAGTLLDVLHDPLTRWTPRKSTPTCSDALPDPTSMGTTVPAPPIPRSDMRVALAVHAPRSIEKYATEFQKGVRRSLSEMGLDVREVRGIAPPANPRGALPTALLDLPLIDVQLLAPDGDQDKPAPDGATIRLSDSRGATQTTLDCATQDCTTAQLVRFVRRNAAALVDGGEDTRGNAQATSHGAVSCIRPIVVCKDSQLALLGTHGSLITLSGPPVPPPVPAPHFSRTVGLGVGIPLVVIGIAGLATGIALPPDDTVKGTTQVGNATAITRWDTEHGKPLSAIGGSIALLGGAWFLLCGLRPKTWSCHQ